MGLLPRGTEYATRNGDSGHSIQSHVNTRRSSNSEGARTQSRVHTTPRSHLGNKRRPVSTAGDRRLGGNGLKMWVCHVFDSPRPAGRQMRDESCFQRRKLSQSCHSIYAPRRGCFLLAFFFFAFLFWWCNTGGRRANKH